MLKRASLLLASGLAIVAILGMSTPASASAIDPGPEIATSVKIPNPAGGADLTIVPGQTLLFETGPDGAINREPVSKSRTAKLVSYGPCVLYPSVTYLRESTGYNAIGAKPYTKCSTPVSKITHNANIYTVEWWGASILVRNFAGSNYNSASYQPLDLVYYCKNKNTSRWWTVTSGTTVYGGKTYYSSVATAISEWPCGTR